MTAMREMREIEKVVKYMIALENTEINYEYVLNRVKIAFDCVFKAPWSFNQVKALVDRLWEEVYAWQYEEPQEHILDIARAQ